jgi:hypothetical protein
MIINDELGKIWKEAFVTSVNVLSHYFTAWTKKGKIIVVPVLN